MTLTRPEAARDPADHGRLARLASTRRARAATRDLVTSCAHHLRPGLYLRYGETVWHHWQTALPDHLRLSKSVPVTSRRRLPSRVSAAVQRWLPPVALRVGGPRSGAFSIAVAADDGGMVLLDPAGGKVGRTYGSGPVRDDYVRLRRRYERHLQTPRFEVLEGGELLVEEFVDGEHLASLAPEAQVRVVRTLLERYAVLTRAEGEATCPGLMEAVVGAVERGDLPAGLADLLRAERFLARSASWPLVPSATDAHMKNLVVTDDGRPVPIDLGNLRLDPFFYFPVGVIALGRGAPLDRFLTGGLDPQVNELFAAAGDETELTGSGRRALLALRTALSSHREATRTGAFDQDAFDRAFRRRWSRLWSGEPPAFSR